MSAKMAATSAAGAKAYFSGRGRIRTPPFYSSETRTFMRRLWDRPLTRRSRAAHPNQLTHTGHRHERSLTPLPANSKRGHAVVERATWSRGIFGRATRPVDVAHRR